MDSTRQQRINKLIQKDLAEIFQAYARDRHKGTLLTITKVRVTPDLGLARVYVSIFPTDKTNELFGDIQDQAPHFKRQLATRTKNQLRKIPEIEYFVDDSLDYEENIDRLLKGGGENPIK